jgi:hypothetical protein
LFSLFSYASKDSLDDLIKQWAIEQKHVVRLVYGELNLQSALDTISKFSKYLMGTDARIINTINSTNDIGDSNKKGQSMIVDDYYKKNVSSSNSRSNTFWVVIRHNLGENYSYFLNKMFLQFFALLDNPVNVMTEYDETTISVRKSDKGDQQVQERNKEQDDISIAVLVAEMMMMAVSSHLDKNHKANFHTHSL